jgi:tetratricopeptide (TPR) repeat protein
VVFSRRLVRLALLVLPVLAATGTEWGRAAPATFPQAARDRYDQGQELQQQGRLEEAIKAYEEAIRLGMKYFPRAHLYKANSFLDLKKYEDAIAQYTEFLERFSLEESCRH